jgi:hypothetical protein
LDVHVHEARRTDKGLLEASLALKVRQFVTVVVPAAVAHRVEGRGKLYAVDEDHDALETQAIVEHRCRVVLDPMTDRIISVEALEASMAEPA